MTKFAIVACIALLLAFFIVPTPGLSENDRGDNKAPATADATASVDTCYFEGDFFPQYICLNQPYAVHFWAETCDLLPDCYGNETFILEMRILERDVLSDDVVIHHNWTFPTGGLTTGVPFEYTFPELVLSNWIVGDGDDDEGEFYIEVTSSCLAEDMFLGYYRYAEIVYLINEDPPDVPTLVSPVHGATDVMQPLLLDWDDVSGAVEYQVQIDDDYEFLTPDRDEVVAESELELYGLLCDTRYYWRVRSRTDCPWGEWSTSYRDFTTADYDCTDVVDVGSPGLPERFHLSQNYPNPFNPSTQFDFALPTASHVRIDVYNIVGARVRTLVDEYMSAGHKTVTFDSKDDNGMTLASGIYVYRIVAGDYTDSKKMVLLK